MSKENISQHQSVSQILRNLQSGDKQSLQREIENKQRQFEESQKVMKELGVTSILEEIRNAGEVVYYRHENYTRTEFPFGFIRMRYFTQKVDPAVIQYSNETTSVKLLFDAKKELDYYDDSLSYVFINPNSVYVEKRGDDLFVGGTTSTNYEEKKVIETKVESKNQLPELIARTIHTVSPYLQLTSTPEKVKWHRQTF